MSDNEIEDVEFLRELDRVEEARIQREREFHERWQAQPRDEEQRNEMERERAEVDMLREHDVFEMEQDIERLGDEWMWEDSDDSWIWDYNDVQMGGAEEDEAENGATSKGDADEVPYTLENVKQTKSKKFRTNAMDYSVHFSNTYADLDLIEQYERTQNVFDQLLTDITKGMDENDQARFVLRSTQLNTPISLPFMPVSHLTPERVFSQIERVVQSNRHFRLNDTVFVDIVHVEMPRGSGRTKRAQINLDKYLKKKRSIITISNKDDLCMARALVVAIAKIEKNPRYSSLLDSRISDQERAAKELHVKAGVPLGPCGIPEVKLFQKYLTEYEINVVSMEHGDVIIHPSQPGNGKPIYLYLHHGHYDVITTMPGFLSRAYYCHTCRKSYSNRLYHLCPTMCKLCRSENCVAGQFRGCDLCNRTFKSQVCYEQHLKSVGKGKSVCEGVKKCLYCCKSVSVYNLDPKKHMCSRAKCKTCGVLVENADISNHLCYMRKPTEKNSGKDEEIDEVLEYNELLFFDFECRQENGIHEPNLCILHNESGKEWLFQGDNTCRDFCRWLFTEEHRGCVALAHNFQGYDGYFIQNFLNNNGVKYDVIMRGAKILSLKVPMFDIRFVDSLNFIPMALAKFPATFGMNELCKGYFPHLFNKRENECYVGPIPCEPYYNPDSMTPENREVFRAWHKEQKDNNYVFDFNKEIIKYCRSDVDILRRCCMKFRELFREVSGVDPFGRCLTIASACYLVFQTLFLKEDTIAIIHPQHHLKTKQSNMAVRWLTYVSEKEGILVEHVRNGGEKRFGPYSLDGYCSETNTAYEFQGCFWHGCSTCYAKNTVNPVNGKTMHQLFEETLEKICYLKSHGLKVVEMWECELRKELEQDEQMSQFFEQCGLQDPLQPRDAFFGGRTNAAKLFHKCEEGEEIRYVDFTSLYPWCNKSTETVVGHPQIITENFEDISSYFGLIKCTVLPPRGLLHPVLPYHTPGKLLFPLCKTCADTSNQERCDHNESERAILGTWCHVELVKALEKGYKILELYEVWHFPTHTDDLFKEYVDTFLKIKQEASGYPKECVTEEQKQAYVDEYFEKEGIRLDRDKIEYNPGLRALAKLMLNSFWGKFGQRPNAMKVEMITDPTRYFDLLTSDKIVVHDARIVNDMMIEVQYKSTEDFMEPSSKSNVVIAAFTTAYARLKLYELLDLLQDRVLYYDTDSVVYVHRPGEPNPPLGNYLGELTDELNGDYITTFISGGPKNYAYRTKSGKTETKVRGITLNSLSTKKINPEVIQALVHLHVNCKTEAKVTVDIPFKITRDKEEKNIVTKKTKKDYRIVYDKRVIVENYETIPYGY